MGVRQQQLCFQQGDGISQGDHGQTLGEEMETWFGLGDIAACGTCPRLGIGEVLLKHRKTSWAKLCITFRSHSEITVGIPLQYNHNGMSKDAASHTLLIQVRKPSSEHCAARSTLAGILVPAHQHKLRGTSPPNLTTTKNISAPHKSRAHGVGTQDEFQTI